MISSVLSRLWGRLQGREVEVDMPHDLPLVPMDALLVDQLFVNLIENVLRYTPAGSPPKTERRISAAKPVHA